VEWRSPSLYRETQSGVQVTLAFSANGMPQVWFPQIGFAECGALSLSPKISMETIEAGKPRTRARTGQGGTERRRTSQRTTRTVKRRPARG
jgi:hypothetical protein